MNRSPETLIREALEKRAQIILQGRDPRDGWFVCAFDEAVAYQAYLKMMPPEEGWWPRIAGMHLIVGEP
jgi:hypothetical protein